MWPWDELGLAPTGDERLIRKAYAERARQCRPDDDSAGFIRLRAAYEAALAAAARMTAGEAGKIVQLDEFRGRPAPPKPEPTAKPAPEPIRIERPAFPEMAPIAEPDEPTAKAPILPRDRGVRIERVEDGGPAEAPPRPPASIKPKVRIERVSPETAAPARPSPPPARPKIRIERVVPPDDSSEED
jgi:hypothetical protein